MYDIIRTTKSKGGRVGKLTTNAAIDYAPETFARECSAPRVFIEGFRLSLLLHSRCLPVIIMITLYTTVCWCAPNLDDLEDYSEGDKSSRFATGISCTELHALAPRTRLDEAGLGLLQEALSGTRVRRRNRIFLF